MFCAQFFQKQEAYRPSYSEIVLSEKKAVYLENKRREVGRKSYDGGSKSFSSNSSSSSRGRGSRSGTSEVEVVASRNSSIMDW